MYEGPDDSGDTEHVEVVVTTETRTVMGVTCDVVHDVETVFGELQEASSAWTKKAVRHGSYEGVLKTKDYSATEPGLVEHKYYARDVGPIFEINVEGEPGQLELIEMTEPA